MRPALLRRARLFHMCDRDTRAQQIDIWKNAPTNSRAI